MLFRARQFEFVFPRPALVMGIVNVTPDSFSDGGKFFDPARAVAHALELIAQGADMLDIGGESTRPNAEPVNEAEELRRVLPVIEQLAAQLERGRAVCGPENPKLPGEVATRPAKNILLSIDTMKPAVARAALAAGANIVNDVGANRQADAMWEIVAKFRAGYVCMHAPGSPPPMQQKPACAEVVSEVDEFFQERMEKLAAAGVAADQVVLDVGIGFGKTLEQNLELLANLGSFNQRRRPLLLGVSRKSFIGKLLGAEVDARLPASLACAILAVASGVQILRTHDVGETVQAVRMAEALLARRKS